jgi:hypothetical protein
VFHIELKRGNGIRGARCKVDNWPNTHLGKRLLHVVILILIISLELRLLGITSLYKALAQVCEITSRLLPLLRPHDWKKQLTKKTVLRLYQTIFTKYTATGQRQLPPIAGAGAL